MKTAYKFKNILRTREIKMIRGQPWVYGLPDEAKHWSSAKIENTFDTPSLKHPGFTASKKRYLIKDERKASKDYIALGFPRIAKDERRHARIIKRTKVR